MKSAVSLPCRDPSFPRSRGAVAETDAAAACPAAALPGLLPAFFRNQNQLAFEAVGRPLRLNPYQLGIETVLGQQLLVAALLHQLAMLQNDDAIGVAQRGQAVAMAMVVRPVKTARASWIAFSDSVSTLLVASSRMRMRGS